MERLEIMEKIKKTLELGRNNPNENEAQTAILMAQKLMVKHHIQEEELEVLEESDQNVIEEEAQDVKKGYWRRALIIVLSRNFRCDVYRRIKERVSRTIIVGSEEDIAIVKRLYQYTENSILINFEKYIKDNYEIEYLSQKQRNQIRTCYASGFVEGLSQKLEQQKINNKEEWGLVVVNKAVQEFMKEKDLQESRSRKVQIEDDDAFMQGHKDGKNSINIDKGIGGNENV